MDMVKKDKTSESGFSLIELLVVIAILATVIGFAVPNFLGARSRARDARRKGELNQMKTSLQLYFNDYKSFPDDSGGPMYNQIRGCGAAGTSTCPCSATLDFAAGASCANVYMTQFPSEFGTAMWYYQVGSGTDFCMKVALENASDSDIAVSQSRCASKCNGLSGTDYAVCSE